MLMRGAGGRGFGEGPRQLAVFFAIVLLTIFFLLVARTVWDQMHGAPVMKLKGPINPRTYQQKVLNNL